MTPPVNTQTKTLQWMTAVMRANPEAHPNWVIAQVARRCPEDATSCNQIYHQARRMVGDAYRAAPISYQPAARLQGTPLASNVTTLEEVTVVGDPNARSANPFLLQLTPMAALEPQQNNADTPFVFDPNF